MAVDHSALATVLDEFAATVTGEFSSEDVLRQLAQSAMRVLDVDGAGVMAPRTVELQRFVFATGNGIGELEQLQETLQDGPCRHAHVHGRLVSVGDLTDVAAWPQWQTRAVELGLRSVTAVPLRARGRSWGVLDLYRNRPGELQEAELAAATTLANLATSYLVVTADRDIAREAQTELAYRAMHDPLTGLPVRGVLLEQLAVALLRLERHPGHLGVLFLDLDDLKYVNDTWGHAAGDRLIATSVGRIRSALRPTDLISRVGGDEFVVVLEGIAGAGDAQAIARRVLEHLAAPYRPNGQTIRPSASIGIVVTDRFTDSGDTLVSHADAAMYRAKNAGPGRYEVFDPDAYAADRHGATIRGELTDALETGQLELHYQPIIDLTATDGGCYAVEALLRWNHPTRGLLTAGEFMSAADRSGLILELGAWVVGEACRQLSTWDSELGEQAPPRLFLNLSVLEIAQPGLAGLVAASASSAGAAVNRLTLEITETDLFTELRTVSVVVRELRELGCDVAIDDFGTGYSSLSRLVQIPASTLKVDGSFTRDLRSSAESRAVVSAVLLLGRSLRRTVIVEGVEDAQTLQVLRELGCTHVQGYHLGLPVHPNRIGERLRTTWA